MPEMNNFIERRFEKIFKNNKFCFEIGAALLN